MNKTLCNIKEVKIFLKLILRMVKRKEENVIYRSGKVNTVYINNATNYCQIEGYNLILIQYL